MNHFPSNLVGREVLVILALGIELEGECAGVRYYSDGGGYINLRTGAWSYTIEAEAIAAIGVNREGEA